MRSKYTHILFAVLVSLIALAIPLQAFASGNQVSLYASMPSQNNEGHHFKVESLKPFCSIPTSDIFSYCTADMDGFFDPNGAANYAGAGVIEFDSGPGVYVYTSGPPSSFHPGAGCQLQPQWNNQGCIYYTGSLTHASEIDLSIEADFYPASGSNPAEWEFWYHDYYNNYVPIGVLVTTIDWFTNVKLRHAETYFNSNNPYYLMDALWEDPLTWSGNWTRFNPPYSIGTSYTNAADANFCANGYYAFVGIPDPGTWQTGTASEFTNTWFCPPGWVG